MTTLTLVGTVHRDPQGLTKLVKDLVRLKPHVITLEFSMYGLTYRRRRKKTLTEKLLQGLQEIQEPETLKLSQLKGLLRSTGIGGIAALLDLPFEYTKGPGSTASVTASPSIALIALSFPPAPQSRTGTHLAGKP